MNINSELASKEELYHYTISQLWHMCIEASLEFREMMLSGNLQDGKPTLVRYIALLTRIWLELLPFVENRTEIDAQTKNIFMSFEPEYKNPQTLMNPNNFVRLFQLEQCLRYTIQKLKVTDL